MDAAPAIIVVGASAGGVEAVRFLAAALPADLRAAVFVVRHIGAHKSEMPWLLNQLGPLRAVHAVSGDAIRAGHIYVAPSDHHLLVEPGCVRLTKGPRENWARPAIDPLFRNAAQAYETGVIGVVLTGGLNDGTAGLHEVKQRGGTAVVQDPADAANPNMPRSALDHVAVDHCMPLPRLPGLLANLVRNRPDCSSQGVNCRTRDSLDRNRPNTVRMIAVWSPRRMPASAPAGRARHAPSHRGRR